MAGRILDIAIAGAGPAGLAAALYLARAGHRVTIFERFETPAPVGSGLILQPTGLTVLDDLGLLADIIALGSRIDRLHGADATSGRTVLDVRYDAQKGGRFGLAVHRAALFGVLFARRAGCRDRHRDQRRPGSDRHGRGAGGAGRCRRTHGAGFRSDRRRDRRPFEAAAVGEQSVASPGRWPMAHSGRRSTGMAKASTRMRCCSATNGRT